MTRDLFESMIEDINRGNTFKYRVATEQGVLYWGWHLTRRSRATGKPQFRPDNRGTKHGRVKLTSVAVIDIRARAASGESHAAIGKVHGVSHATVGKIARRERWTHI